MLFSIILSVLGYLGDSSSSSWSTISSPPIVSIPTSYTASYGRYSTQIPVNDPLMRPDFDRTKCGGNCWGTSGYNHYERAFQRAQDVQNAQREAFWADGDD